MPAQSTAKHNTVSFFILTLGYIISFIKKISFGLIEPFDKFRPSFYINGLLHYLFSQAGRS